MVIVACPQCGKEREIRSEQQRFFTCPACPRRFGIFPRLHRPHHGLAMHALLELTLTPEDQFRRMMRQDKFDRMSSEMRCGFAKSSLELIELSLHDALAVAIALTDIDLLLKHEMRQGVVKELTLKSDAEVQTLDMGHLSMSISPDHTYTLRRLEEKHFVLCDAWKM